MIELIIPPNPYLDDEMRNPPLGLLYIAAVMEKYDVHIVDLRGRPVEDFHELISDADIYGITATTPDYLLSLEIARIIKAKNPRCWTVLGGAHATAVPQQIDPEFDKVVVGEGELAFQQIVQDFYTGMHERRFYKYPYIENLDSIPFPARHLLPMEASFSGNTISVGGELAGGIIASRGCPFNCAFCASKVMWQRKVRFRSPQNTVDEIAHIIRDYGVEAFRFHDDTMTLDQQRLKRLCELLIPLGVRWRANARVDISSLETLRMMRQAGCEELGYGIESLSQMVLDRCNKGTSLQDIHLALRNAKLAGIKCRLFFIIGLPGEPPGFADRLEELINTYDPNGVNVSTFVPYPGSAIFSHPERYGIVLKDVPSNQFHTTLGFRDGEIDRPLTFVHDVMSEEQIIEERRRSLELVKQAGKVKNFSMEEERDADLRSI